MKGGFLSVEGSSRSKGNMNSKHTDLKRKERSSQSRQRKEIEGEIEGRTEQGSRGQYSTSNVTYTWCDRAVS